jgi:hypothetical protein
MNMSRRVQYEVTHLTTSLGLIEKGLGLSVLPRMVPPANAHFIIYIQFMPFRVTAGSQWPASARHLPAA